MKVLRHLCCLVLLTASLCASTKAEHSPKIKTNTLQTSYIVQKLNQAFSQNINGANANWAVSFVLDSLALGTEDYRITKQNGTVVVRGGGRRGLIYGGQEVLAQVRNGVALSDLQLREGKARQEFRAIKFNLPWFSYRDGPALQQHTEVCKKVEFWEKFLDMMSENRFNALTLWNLHPFPYMIQSKNFPEARMFSDAEMKEWRNLYTRIFEMAHERGIETYLVNWNIYAPDAFLEKHNLTTTDDKNTPLGDAELSPVVQQYNKESLTQVIDEYPLLTGFGFSLGEKMGKMTPAEREQWALDTYVEAVKAASRPIKLIHRVPFSGNTRSEGSTSADMETITRRGIESIDVAKGPILVEVKFNWSHAHSTPKLIKTHGGPLHDKYWNPKPDNYKIVWMARNEDFFCLRWGQPDFIREHIAQNDHDYTAGYFLGSECYIPALDYFSKLDDVKWEYAFERQWYYYMVWGRLLYDSSTSDAVFENEFTRRYGKNGPRLFRAYNAVSKVPLQLISSFNIGWDYTMYAEGFTTLLGPGGTRLISIEDLIRHPPLDPAYMNAEEFVKIQQSGKTVDKDRITPLQLADRLEAECRQGLADVKSVSTENDNTLRYEVTDVQAWANLGLYFAQKLRAAVALETARVTDDATMRKQAAAELEKAIDYWKELVAVTEPVYKPFPVMVYRDKKDQYFHWSKLMDDVEAERESLTK